jgi:hypothetical protein
LGQAGRTLSFSVFTQPLNQPPPIGDSIPYPVESRGHLRHGLSERPLSLFSRIKRSIARFSRLGKNEKPTLSPPQPPRPRPRLLIDLGVGDSLQRLLALVDDLIQDFLAFQPDTISLHRQNYVLTPGPRSKILFTVCFVQGFPERVGCPSAFKISHTC